MAVELVDTHCHLDWDPLRGQVEAVLERARAAGLRCCITIGTSVEKSRVNVQLAHQYPMLRAAVGIHPNDAEGATEESFAAIEELAHDPSVVAIGEIGLDAYRDHASPASQQHALRALLAIASRRRLPALFHCRDAYDALIKTLREHGQPPLRGVIHCASGPPEFIRSALEMGLHISFAGNVTFPNAAALRALVPLVPDERLLLETDAPFLAPQPVRGKTNEPAYVAHTAACVAGLRGVTVEELGTLTSRNAQALFHLPDLASS